MTVLSVRASPATRVVFGDTPPMARLNRPVGMWKPLGHASDARRIDSIVPYHVPAILLSQVVVENTLRRSERILLRQFLDRRIVSMTDAIEILWGMKPDGGPLAAEKCVAVYITRIRAGLRGNWRIKHHGHKTWVLVPN